MIDNNMSADYIEEKLSYFLERERLDQAESLLAQAFRKDPNNTTLIFYSAYIAYLREDYDGAEISLKEALQSDPDDEKSRTILCRVFIAQKKYAQAEKLIIDLIQDFPREAYYYSIYAELMLETLHVTKAKRLSEEALRLEPELTDSVTVSLLCDVIGRNSKDANEKLGMLIRENPDAESTARSLLLVLIERNNHKEALRIARQLLLSNPSDQSMVDLINELRVQNHPTMIPLYPLVRYGWHASAVIWLLAMVSIWYARQYCSESTAGIVTIAWVFYVVYSWVYPWILRRILI